MSRVFYNKLIRDNIPAKIEEKGEEFETRKLDDPQEFQQELLKKVNEEARALAHARTREEFIDEYADLMVTLDALADLLELSEADITVAVEENAKKKGGYTERIFLHWSDDSEYKSNESPQGIR